MWIKALHDRGVMAIAWWQGYHRSFDWDKFPEACHLKDHLLTLPIHQDLGTKHMKAIAACVNDIAAASESSSRSVVRGPQGPSASPLQLEPTS